MTAPPSRETYDPPNAAPPPTRPEHWAVERSGGVVAVRWAWRSPRHVALALFTLLWFGGLALFAVVAWLGGGPTGPGAGGSVGPATAAAFVALPLIHLMIGAILGYVALAGLRNRTTVAAGRGRVRVRHEPLWWPGGGTRDLTGSDRLRPNATDAGFATSGPDLIETRYALDALGRGTRVTLVRGIRGENAARFLSRELGEALELTAEEPVL